MGKEYFPLEYATHNLPLNFFFFLIAVRYYYKEDGFVEGIDLFYFTSKTR